MRGDFKIAFFRNPRGSQIIFKNPMGFKIPGFGIGFLTSGYNSPLLYTKRGRNILQIIRIKFIAGDNHKIDLIESGAAVSVDALLLNSSNPTSPNQDRTVHERPENLVLIRTRPPMSRGSSVSVARSTSNSSIASSHKEREKIQYLPLKELLTRRIILKAGYRP